MGIYKDFADYYDDYMYDIDYTDWVYYLCRISHIFSLDGVQVLDMGCGTGSLAKAFALQGACVTGVDNSEAMLRIAKKKCAGLWTPVQFHCADIVEYQDSSAYRLINAACDTINYILNADMLYQLFQRVFSLLETGGYFTFDVLNPGYPKLLKNRKFITKQYTYKFSSHLSKGGAYYTTVRIRKGFELCAQEEHIQQLYSLDFLIALLNKIGFKKVDTYEFYTEKKAGKRSDKYQIICKKV